MTTAPISTDEPKAFGYATIKGDGGETALIYPRTSLKGEDEPQTVRRSARSSSGVIFTDRQDMPSLEQLLQENRLSYAVLEREAPIAPRPTGYARVMAGAALATALSTAGVVLLVDAVADNAIRANPYTAVSLAIGGIILFLTLLVAVRTSLGRREPTGEES